MATERPLGDEIDVALERCASAFANKNIRYSLIGGLATLLRGRPRFTQDIDFILDVPQLKLPGLLDDLIALGFDLDPMRVIPEYVRQNMTTFRFGNTRIDWLRPALPLYARAMNDATTLDWNKGFPIQVATAEGIILTKMVAFRSQDQVDIETLISANPELDASLIRNEWSSLAAAYPDRTTWLESAFARLLPAS